MTFPALSLLKVIFPSARLDMLARPWVEPIYRCHPNINRVIPSPAGTGAAARLIEMAKTAGRIGKENYDMGVLFPNSFESALLFRLAGIPEIVGYDTDFRKLLLTRALPIPEDKENRHHLYYYVDLIKSICGRKNRMDSSVLNLDLKLPEDEKEKARAFLYAIIQKRRLNDAAFFIGLNPGAAFGPAKCWPADRFRRLARLLLDAFPDLHILVFGTDKEREISEEIKKADQDRITSLCGSTELMEAVAIISELALLVTNDSGLMHVGAACHTPLIAIFGSTNPVATGPWSDNARIIRRQLECSPCMDRTCARNFECMLGISPEEVFEASMAVLKAARGRSA